MQIGLLAACLCCADVAHVLTRALSVRMKSVQNMEWIDAIFGRFWCVAIGHVQISNADVVGHVDIASDVVWCMSEHVFSMSEW